MDSSVDLYCHDIEEIEDLGYQIDHRNGNYYTWPNPILLSIHKPVALLLLEENMLHSNLLPSIRKRREYYIKHTNVHGHVPSPGQIRSYRKQELPIIIN